MKLFVEEVLLLNKKVISSQRRPYRYNLIDLIENCSDQQIEGNCEHLKICWLFFNFIILI